jgi:nucleoside-triphosphatase
VSAGGFITREIREHGRRKGFEIVTLDGQQGVLAHVEIRGGKRIGKYGVDIASVDEVGVPAIQQAMIENRVVVIDEIGPMEILSKLFSKVVLEVLQSDAIMLGTIAKRRMPFTDQIRAMPQVSLVEVRRDNRETLCSHIAESIIHHRSNE